MSHSLLCCPLTQPNRRRPRAGPPLVRSHTAETSQSLDRNPGRCVPEHGPATPQMLFSLENTLVLQARRTRGLQEPGFGKETLPLLDDWGGCSLFTGTV